MVCRKSFLLLAASLAQTRAGNGKPTLDYPFQTSFRKLPQTPCVSLFTREGRAGCGAYSREPMVGALLSWSALSQSNYYGRVSSSTLPNFIAVLDEYEYTSDNVDKIIALSNGSLLQGIIVLNHTDSSEASMYYTSPESASPRGQDTPSENLTPNNDYAWNNGDGLMHKDMYGIPTGYVSDEDIADYIDTASRQQAEEYLIEISDIEKSVFEEDGVKFPPIMAEFDLYMGPEGTDSRTCLNWTDADGSWSPKCLPLGGNSIWAVAGSPYERNGNGDGDGDGNGNADERRTEDADGKKPIVMVSTNIDATSMFHEDARGANTAASNILTVLMAAKMFGEAVTDQQLDQMENKVMFSFFQGENYGYMGSRSFFRDVAYPGFQCDSSTVTAIAKNKDDADAKMACLSPLRHDMDFENLGDIVNMISVDQVGILGTNSTFYVHDSNSGYYSDGALSGILTGLSSDDWNIVAASAGAIPPTPLSSLVNLSGGTVGGVVLAGYDAAFVDTSFYMSHSDSTKKVSIQMKSIAKAATIVARAALAAAYGEYYEAGSAMDAIEDLDKDDETFTTLASCLFSNGSCELLTNYATMENENMKAVSASESSYGVGASLGNPPNYYVSVFDWRNGQAFVQVDGVTYGSYNKEDKQYGASDKDEFFIRPNMLEASIHGLLNDFLGRGSVDSNGDTADLKSCSSTKDCSNVNYCQSSSDQAICSGSKVCVCSRSHYHVALDEAIIPSQNNFTGVFVVSDDDEGVSPMYTEPYWDSGIGVRVYRDSGDTATWTLALGASAAICSVVATYFMKSRLQKEKLY